MLLRRLLGVSGRLRRPLSTAASSRPPPWIMVEKLSVPTGSVPRAHVRVVEPPRVSTLWVPANLIPTTTSLVPTTTSLVPDPDSDANGSPAPPCAPRAATAFSFSKSSSSRTTRCPEGPATTP